MNTVRWNISVSSEIDRSLRMFLASEGGGRKGDLSRFIEEAVRAQLFRRAVEQTKAENAHLGEKDLSNLVDEAVDWVRQSKGK